MITLYKVIIMMLKGIIMMPEKIIMMLKKIIMILEEIIYNNKYINPGVEKLLNSSISCILETLII